MSRHPETSPRLVAAPVPPLGPVPGASTDPSPHVRQASVALAAVFTLLAVASVYMVPSMFREIAESLHISLPAARFTFAVTSLTYAVSLAVFGPLSDRFGRERVAGAGGLVLGALAVLASRQTSYSGLLIVLASMGAAAAAIPAAAIPYVAEQAPPGQTGRYVGIILAATIVGIAVGRSVLGIVAAATSWRTAFVIVAAANALLAVTVLSAAKLRPGSPAAHPAQRRSFSALAVPFVDGASRQLLATGFLLYFGYLGVITFLNLRLAQPPYQFGAREIGWLSLSGLIGVAGAPLSGALVDRWGSRRVAALGIGVTLLGVVVLFTEASLTTLVLGMLATYLGVFANQPSLLVLLQKNAPARARGAVSAVYMLASLLGGSAATTFLGPLFRSHGFRAVSGLCAGSVLAAMLLMLRATAPRTAPALVLGKVTP
jgi:YNFM family putative membrane transporter